MIVEAKQVKQTSSAAGNTQHIQIFSCPTTELAETTPLISVIWDWNLGLVRIFHFVPGSFELDCRKEQHKAA